MAIADLLYVSVVVFALAIVFGIVFMVQGILFPQLQAQMNSDSAVVNKVITDSQGVFPIFDTVLLVAFFGSMTAILVLAYLLPVSPIMAAINLVAMMVVFLITPVLANSYLNIAAAIPGVDVSVTYPFTFYLLTNYPLFVMVFGFMLFILLVARFGRDGNDI